MVLLTGFGPFPGTPVNDSASLVRRVARLARRRLPDFRFSSAVLPTEWTRAPRRIEELHRRHRPLLALHFGVAPGTRGIRLEAEARNICRAACDAAGIFPPSSQLCEGGPARRPASIDVRAIADALNAGGSACSISHDAGGYLCNAVLYHSLGQAAEASRGCRVGFVHVSPHLSAQPMLFQQTVATAFRIIEIALRVMPAEGPVRLNAIEEGFDGRAAARPSGEDGGRS